MMHEQNEQMMHALMHWEPFNYTFKTKNGLEYKDLEQEPPIFWKTHFLKFNQIE